MPCDRSLETQAYFDGELDAAGALAAERHVMVCMDCAALLKDLTQLREQVRTEVSYHRAPDALRSRITSGKEHSAARAPWYRSVWTGAAGGAAATALAASLVFSLMLPPTGDALVTDLANAHLRSLASGHTIDVASSDRHTVKPWLAAHADLSPPIGDFGAQGFVLKGGRVDFVDGVRAAVTVYAHRAHVINVFAWKASHDLPGSVTRSGYHLIFWRQGDMAFCAVSDIGEGDLRALVARVQAPAMPQGRE